MLAELANGSIKLTDNEKKIIDLRISGLSVLETPIDESIVLSDLCIFKTSAICGFSLSTSKEFADILNEEFRILLLDFGFSNLTFDEIIMAFRMNARGGYRYSGSGDFIQRVNSYSSFFSIDYAAQVLNNYMAIRNAIDSKIKDFIETKGVDISEKYK